LQVNSDKVWLISLKITSRQATQNTTTLLKKEAKY